MINNLYNNNSLYYYYFSILIKICFKCIINIYFFIIIVELKENIYFIINNIYLFNYFLLN